MVKRVFVTIIGALVALSLVGVGGFYFYDDIEFVVVMSGNVVNEKVVGFYEASSIDNRVSILLQFIVGIIALVLIFFVIRMVRSKKSFSKQDFVNMKVGKSQTDLDKLYEVLKWKKSINIVDVERVFEVDSDTAVAWAKILENGDLAIIDYPRFGKPVLRLVEEEEEEENEKVKKDRKKEKVGAARGGRRPKAEGRRTGTAKKKVRVKKVKVKKVKVKKVKVKKVKVKKVKVKRVKVKKVKAKRVKVKKMKIKKKGAKK